MRADAGEVDQDRRRRALRAALVRPQGASLRTSCRALATLFAVVGVLALVSALVSPAQDLLHDPLVWLAVLAVGLGGAVWRWWEQLPSWAFWAAHALLSLQLGYCVATAPSWAAALSCAALYVLLLTESFFVLSWVEAGIEFCLGAACLLLALLARGGTDSGSIVLFTGVIAANCVVTGWLVRAGDRADLDSLTGALARRGAQRAGDAMVLLAERTGRPLALALIDMDHFKHVNDTLGHAAGDDLLVRVAAGARQITPRGAVFGRWGGDEFVLAVLDADGAAVAALVEALRGHLPAGRTLSAGVADLAVGDDLAALVSKADQALYDVKRTGRGTTSVLRTDRTHGQVVEAVATGALALGYRPVVELAGGQVTGAMASALGPTGEDVVEGLSAALVERALADAQRWPRVPSSCFTGAPGPALVVLRLGRGDEAGALAERSLAVLDGLRASRADPERLVVTLPEPLLDAASDRVRDAVAPLRAAGVRVVLTEVGTGALSLARLVPAPVDGLWFSARLLPAAGSEDAAASSAAAGVVAGIAGLFAGPGRLVGIGGIATPDQAAWAARQGCTHGWGPLWSGAISTDRLGALVAGRGAPASGQVLAAPLSSSSHEELDSQPSMRSDAGS